MKAKDFVYFGIFFIVIGWYLMSYAPEFELYCLDVYMENAPVPESGVICAIKSAAYSIPSNIFLPLGIILIIHGVFSFVDKLFEKKK